ncbi:hypothetical protein CYMTET_43166 [Cymbomonas tetramitiformis]|uniref:EF-hand domain-containing protein n=1 Tax=Cymbomonas tetramitiformis TaxID=36881 RepID=A0AAE0C2T8_9CHLO|nr:hypothetical protein CYMTET_43166 [Cymbomonas tetramitiformis]|eukprot:gene10296-12178_t
MGCGSSKAKSFEFFDGDNDGKVTLAELTAACTANGEADPENQARMMLEKFDANRDGILDDTEFAELFGTLYPTLLPNDEVTTSHLHQRELVSESDPIKKKSEQIFASAKEVASGMGVAVCMVLADHEGNEIGFAKQPAGANSFMLKVARGKVLHMRRCKDHSKTITAPSLGMVAPMARMVAGSTKEVPIEGALMIEYKVPPTMVDVIGYIAVAGCPASVNDKKVAREALCKQGLQEIPGKPNCFRFSLNALR